MLVPKSISLIPVFERFLRRIFSGLMSEWMMFCSLRKASPLKSWRAKVRMYCKSIGLKLLASSRSYKLILSNSVTMQMCFRKTIKSFILKMFFSLSMSFYFARIRMFISFRASCMCSFFDLIIFRATISLLLWSNARTTSPNAPLPKHSSNS